MRSPLERNEAAFTTTRLGARVETKSIAAVPAGTVETRYPFLRRPGTNEGVTFLLPSIHKIVVIILGIFMITENKSQNSHKKQFILKHSEIIIRHQHSGYEAGHPQSCTTAKLRNYRCKKDKAEIAKALTGTWRDEHLFVLKQALELYDFYTTQIEVCDAEIEHTYALIRPDWLYDGPEKFPKKKNHSHSRNAPKNGNGLRRYLMRIAGVDLAAVDGISVSIAQTVISEIGTDMSKWPTVKHFCSWLGLAPRNDVTGGKVIRSRTYKTKNRAGQAFRLAASSVTRADCAFGAFYRRKKSQLGPAQAIVATAHMIAAPCTSCSRTRSSTFTLVPNHLTNAIANNRSVTCVAKLLNWVSNSSPLEFPL